MKPLSIGFDVPFSEAIAQAKARGVVLPSVYYGELQGVARQLAFSVAGLASLDQLQAVKDSMDKAMGEGLTFGEWQKLQATKDMNLPAHRLDNIFRTNLQGNYMAGKWQQFMVRANDDSPRQTYLLYDAVNDSRVRPSHLAMDGVIRRVDDPYWATHSPPNGYRCRCSLTTLSEAEAQARSGIGRGLHKTPMVKDPRTGQETPAMPDKDWDYNPYKDRMAKAKEAMDTKSQSGSVKLYLAMQKK